MSDGACSLGIIAFVAWSIEFLEVDLERLIGVFPRLGTLLASRYYPPDLDYVLASDFLRSVVQTLQMSLLGGLFGVIVAIPLAWFSAHNVTPGRRSAYPSAAASLSAAGPSTRPSGRCSS